MVVISFIKYLYSDFVFFQVLKRLSVYSVFILFLSNFLFPQFVDSISNDNTLLTEDFIELDVEEESENEEESEEYEEAESDDLFQHGIYQPLNLNRLNTINYLSYNFPLSSLKDIGTPPPEFYFENIS